MNTKGLILSIYAHVPLLSCVGLLSFHITYLHCGYNVSAALIYWFTGLDWNRFEALHEKSMIQLPSSNSDFLIFAIRMKDPLWQIVTEAKDCGSWTILFLQFNGCTVAWLKLLHAWQNHFFFPDASCVLCKWVEPERERQTERVLLK